MNEISGNLCNSAMFWHNAPASAEPPDGAHSPPSRTSVANAPASVEPPDDALAVIEHPLRPRPGLGRATVWRALAVIEHFRRQRPNALASAESESPDGALAVIEHPRRRRPGLG